MYFDILFDRWMIWRNCDDCIKCVRCERWCKIMPSIYSISQDAHVTRLLVLNHKSLLQATFRNSIHGSMSPENRRFLTFSMTRRLSIYFRISLMFIEILQNVIQIVEGTYLSNCFSKTLIQEKENPSVTYGT